MRFSEIMNSVKLYILEASECPLTPESVVLYLDNHFSVTVANGVLRYVKYNDKVLNLASVLLKKWFISGVVSRTELGKPYIKNDNMTTFSISHHSDTTVLSLINSKKYVVGVDVVDLGYRSCGNEGNEGFGEFVEWFKNVVGEKEREWCCDTTR